MRSVGERSGIAVKAVYVTDCQGKSLRGTAVEARSGAIRYVLLRWCADWQLWRVLEGALRCDVVGWGLAVMVSRALEGMARCGHVGQSR